MLNSLKALFTPPHDITSIDDVTPGHVILVGTARADDAGVLRSPVLDQTCVAYFYKAIWKAPTRGASLPRVFSQAEVYVAHFRLDLEGGGVRVVPRKSDPFDINDHWKAAAAGLPGFEAREQVIRPGDRIRVRGRLKQEQDDMAIHPTHIEMLGPGVEPEAPTKPPKGKYRPRERRKKSE